MRSHNPKSLNADDKQVVNQFIQYKQNTHNSVVTSSIATALNTLRKKFFSDAKTHDDYLVKIKKHYDQCVDELKKISDQRHDLKPAIDYILQQVNGVPNEFDIVHLTIPGKGKETFTYPLDQVLTLVWMATHDDSSYYHHQDKRDQKQVEQDRHRRLETFYNCLTTLFFERVCHQGIRHQLVYTLNGTCKNIHILIDANSTLLDYYRDHLLEAYSKYGNKQQLKKSLLTWMLDSDVTPLLKDLDSNNDIQNQLRQLFMQHGVDIDSLFKPNVLSEKLESLPFACHPVNQASLYAMYSILYFPEEKAQSKEQIRKKIVTWIEQNADLDSLTDKEMMSHFYFCYQLHSDIQKNLPLLQSAGQMQDKYIELMKDSENVFSQQLEPQQFQVTKSIIDRGREFYQFVEKCKTDKLTNPIQNFFASWYVQELSEEQKKKLYAMLLNDNFQSKVKLDDKEIAELTKESKNNPGEVTLTPYIINRFFLHAIIVPPKEWTRAFWQKIKEIRLWVENNFGQDEKPLLGLNAALKRDSYSDSLLKQIRYLESQFRGQDEKDHVEIQRPDNLLLLPSHCKTRVELQHCIQLLDEVNWEKIYERDGVVLRAMLMVEMKSADHLLRALTLLPKLRREYFLRSVPKEQIKIWMLEDIGSFGQVLGHLSVSQQVEYIKFIGVDFLIELAKKSNKTVSELICLFIPDHDVRLDYLNSLSRQEITRASLFKDHGLVGSHLMRFNYYNFHQFYYNDYPFLKLIGNNNKVAEKLLNSSDDYIHDRKLESHIVHDEKLHIEINQAKKQYYYDEIVNAFNPEQSVSWFSLILNKRFQDSIYLDDKVIVVALEMLGYVSSKPGGHFAYDESVAPDLYAGIDFLKSNDSNTEYILSRLCLHAILVPPEKWSQLYKDAILTLAKDFHLWCDGAMLYIKSMCPHSFNDEKVQDAPIPSQMKCVPWLAKSPSELSKLVSVLDNEALNTLHTTYADRYRTTFETLVKSHQDRKEFLSNLKLHQKLKLYELGLVPLQSTAELVHDLSLLGLQDRIIFLGTVKDIVKRTYCLPDILELIPSRDRYEYLVKFELDRSCVRDADEFVKIMQCLRENEIKKYLDFLGEGVVNQIIKNGEELKPLLKLIPDLNETHYLKRFERYDFLKSKISDDIAREIKNNPSELRKAEFKKFNEKLNKADGMQAVEKAFKDLEVALSVHHDNGVIGFFKGTWARKPASYKRFIEMINGHCQSVGDEKKLKK